MSPRDIVEIVAVVIFVLLGALLVFWFNQAQKKETSIQDELHRNGVLVEGSVNELREFEGRGAQIYYRLRYRYSYSDGLYFGKEYVSFDLYRSVNVGDKIRVRCLPDHPKIAQLAVTHTFLME